MSVDRVRQIADAVLFEGYVFHPYRATTFENCYPWTFGIVAPRAFSETTRSEPWRLKAECLLDGGTELVARLRFLQVVARDVEERRDDVFVRVKQIEARADNYVSWEEGLLRELELRLPLGERTATEQSFAFASEYSVEPITVAGAVIGRVIRRRDALSGMVRALVSRPNPDAPYEISIEVENHSHLERDPATRAELMRVSFASTHVLLHVTGGRFISLLAPPPSAFEAARRCQSQGLYPVLVGDRGRADCLFCSPMILDDYPGVVSESSAAFFDASEADEFFGPRAKTLTRDEHRHRGGPEAPRARPRIGASGSVPAFAPGDHVRLRPGTRRKDAQLLYAGAVATVEQVLEDIDGRTCLAVTIDDDPAGELHRWYGRYHYYFEDEVEPIGARR
jgi:hypothetical protein